MRTFAASETANAVFDLQLRIAQELQASEPHKNDEERWHRRRLRNIGDAVAWRVLTAHAFRNLSATRRTPPSLSSQGAAFEHVLDTGRSLVREGMKVIISDVTSCIATGDLLACGDPDAPYIIECKLSAPAPKALMQGRRGRQLSRGRAVGTYLEKNRGFVPGNPAEKVAIEIPHEPIHSWDSVVTVVRDAVSSGVGVVRRDKELIWATRRDASGTVPDELADVIRPDEPFFVGCHSRLVDEDDDRPHVPHPLAWPVPSDVAFALAEMDVILCHALVASVFEGHSTERARLRGVVELAPGIPGVDAEIDGEKTQLGPRFIGDVLYGFETVESAAHHMLAGLERSQDEMRRLVSELPPDPIPLEKPRVHHIETRADLERLREAKEAGSVTESDLIFFGEELSRELGLDDRPIPHGRVVIVGSRPKKSETGE
jgi:hypothetical protein